MRNVFGNSLLVFLLAMGLTSKSAAIQRSKPIVIASNQGRLNLIAIDDQSLFWSGYDSRKIVTAPVTGGPTKILAEAANGEGVSSLFAYKGTLFWTETGGTLNSISTLGGRPNVLASGLIRPDSLYAINGYLYWANEGSSVTDGSIMRMPAAGGSVEILASGQRTPRNIVVVSDHVFWSVNATRYEIRGIKLGSASITTIAQAPMPNLRTDGNSIYWLGYGPGVSRLRVSDWNESIFFKDLPLPLALVRDFHVDGDSLFALLLTGWVGDGAVSKYSVSSGAKDVIMVGSRQKNGIMPEKMVADQNFIYWVDSLTESVYKAKK